MMRSVASLLHMQSQGFGESPTARSANTCGFVAGGHARVADMGLARWLTPESMGVLTGETGTYLYMSPEMIRHELYNSRTDVYSWGVLLVELISQRTPYEDHHLTPLQVRHSRWQCVSVCLCSSPLTHAAIQHCT